MVVCDTKRFTAGGLFEISKSDLEQRDSAEGPGYARQDEFPITCLETGERAVTFSLVAATGHCHRGNT